MSMSPFVLDVTCLDRLLRHQLIVKLQPVMSKLETRQGEMALSLTDSSGALVNRYSIGIRVYMIHNMVLPSTPLQTDLSRNLFGHIKKSLAPYAAVITLLGDNRRNSAVSVLADFGVERDIPEEFDAQALALGNHARVLRAMAMTFTMGEYLCLMTALRAGKVGHIAHHPEDGDVHFLEHAKAADGVAQRDILWGGYDYGAIYDDLLPDCQLHVTGPRRQVQDQHIQRAPGDGMEKLVHSLGDHQTTP